MVGLHAGALYALTESAPVQMPKAAVPLVVSLVTAADQAPPKPKLVSKPRPKPLPKPPKPRPAPVAEAEPPPEPDVVEPPPPVALAVPASAEPETPAPPQVVPPRFDAAYLDNPVPAYPALSRRLGEEGRVMLRVHVGPDGKPLEVRVDESSGSSRLDRAAKEAVERWRFVPARQGQQAVGAWVLVPIKFSLSQRG